jgi:hypothetical protein
MMETSAVSDEVWDEAVKEYMKSREAKEPDTSVS